MGRPPQPRLIARVLLAVANLEDSKGSTAREVLNFIRQSNESLKNLTLQVHRALKHAVNTGLLRHRSGRYKILSTVNPAATPAPTAKEPAKNDRKTEEKQSKPDVRATPVGGAKTPRRESRGRKKRATPKRRRRSSGRRSDNARKKSRRRSPHAKRPRATVQSRKRQKRKRTYDDEEFEDQSSGRDESPAPFDRRTKRSRVSKRELDLSDESDRESDVKRQCVSRAGASSRREPKREETRVGSRGKSASRARSPERSLAHPPVEEEEVACGSSDGQQRRDDAERPEAREDAREGSRDEPNDSNSGSTLENALD